MHLLRRYHNWLALPALIIIAFSLLSGFSNETKPESIESQLLQRTTIMQACMEGMASYGETEKKLSRIETQPLLSEDIRNLKNLADSDFDRVHRMHIVSVENKRNILGNSTYAVRIKWDMEGPEGKYTTEGDYSVVTQKVGEKYLISKFDPIL